MTAVEVLEARLRRVEDDYKKLDEDKAESSDINALWKAFDRLSESVDSLRRAVVTFAFVIAGSAIAFAFSVIQLTS